MIIYIYVYIYILYIYILYCVILYCRRCQWARGFKERRPQHLGLSTSNSTCSRTEHTLELETPTLKRRMTDWVRRSAEVMASPGMLSLSKFSRRSSSLGSPQSSCAPESLASTRVGMGRLQEPMRRCRYRRTDSQHTCAGMQARKAHTQNTHSQTEAFLAGSQ